jgi:hypothetical protein
MLYEKCKSYLKGKSYEINGMLQDIKQAIVLHALTMQQIYLLPKHIK